MNKTIPADFLKKVLDGVNEKLTSLYKSKKRGEVFRINDGQGNMYRINIVKEPKRGNENGEIL